MLKFSWGVIVVFMPLICSNEVFGLGIYVGILNKVVHGKFSMNRPCCWRCGIKANFIFKICSSTLQQKKYLINLFKPLLCQQTLHRDENIYVARNNNLFRSHLINSQQNRKFKTNTR